MASNLPITPPGTDGNSERGHVDTSQSSPSRPGVSTPPPSYTEDGPDVTAAFSNLSLGNKSEPLPTVDRTKAHLKLLEAFHRLRQWIGHTDGLFGINDNFAHHSGADVNAEEVRKDLALIREKRWAVYVARAVHRFEVWWRREIPPSKNGYPTDRLRQSHMAFGSYIELRFTGGRPIQFTKDNLPPLDILMVWHAYMLNPRCFLEDCVRSGKSDFWATGMPWDAVNSCIDNTSFKFKPGEGTRQRFSKTTGLRWDNLEDPSTATLICRGCNGRIECAWTTVQQGMSVEKPKAERSVVSRIEEGEGLADKSFSALCMRCMTHTSHDSLRVEKIRDDIRALRSQDCPMPGTILSLDGNLEDCDVNGPDKHRLFFPNRLLKLDGRGSDDLTGGIMQTAESIEQVRSMIETALKQPSLVARAGVESRAGRVTLHEKFVIRRMMSRYWENHSSFALDLVGAVIRQGSFVEKMHNIDWLHSPAIGSTMERLLHKYTRFFEIMQAYPGKMVVPTLDVDLAWHTHQLSPRAYFDYSKAMTGKFIDHDDKIDETSLSDLFGWTSRTYQRLYGEVYSECTCWYCEAIRETHTSTVSRLIKSKNAMATEKFHDAEPGTTDMHKAPHISTHSSIKLKFDSKSRANITQERVAKAAAKAHVARLEAAYQDACKRARKKGRREPSRENYEGNTYYGSWGYPIPLAYGVPYSGDPCTPEAYPANPGCLSVSEGGSGNCVAGACGGGLGAGNCAGSAQQGGCSSAAGGCSGGGGCGGGGCGGGGGGCGGGGGGG
ncbi:MAG: hypothetical protein M1825_005180 [Sarcosagium campestre]|nr:MAG: hypothetical protein M1825_005180 [Sarcosagium campestre]